MRFSSLLWLALSELRTEPARSRGLAVAVVIGAGLVVAATALGATLQHRVDRGAGVEYAGTDLVLRSAQGVEPGAEAGSTAASGISADDVRRIAALPGIAATGPLVRADAALYVGSDVREVLLESVPTTGFTWQGIAAGRLPRGGAEVALSSETLRDLRLHVGDRVALGSPSVGRSVFRVVGALDVHGSLRYGSVDYGVVTDPVAHTYAGISGFNEVRLRVDPGARVGEVVEEVNASVPVGYPTATADLVAATEQLYGSGLRVLSGLLTGFALVAGLVATVVLASVVSASLPGRRSRLALLRAVGATRGELRALVGLEAGTLALIGAVVAVPLGIGVAAVALPLLGLLPDVPPVAVGDLRLPWALALVPVAAFAFGTAAALVPAWQAGRISPAAALREQAAPAGRTSRPALVGAAVLGSLVLLLLPASQGNLLLTACAGVLVAVVLVASTPTACSALAAAAAALVRGRHPVGALAAAQLHRFPGRASAAGIATSLAATVLALSWVALGSIASTADDRAEHDSGPALMLGAYAGGGVLESGTIERLVQTPGVAEVVPIESSSVTLVGPRARHIAGGPAPTSVAGNVVSTDVRDLATVTGRRFVLRHLEPGAVYLPSSDLAPFVAGSTVRLEGPAGHRDLRVRRYVDDLPFQALVAPADVHAVGAEVEPRAVWIELAAGADRRTVLDAVRVVAIESGGLPVSGSVTAQVRLDRAIDLARGLATYMLGLSVLIAVLGAALTVATTVRERTAELATLRLLGMDAPSVRRLVAVETWATGALSVLVGLGLGILLGRVAVTSTAGALDLAVHVQVPVLPLLLLGLVQLLVLRIAVLGPLRRVSTLSPLRALRGSYS